jgi:hypothetical protein
VENMFSNIQQFLKLLPSTIKSTIEKPEAPKSTRVVLAFKKFITSFMFAKHELM